MANPKIDNYEQRTKEANYWGSTSQFAYGDLAAKWRGESCLGFKHPDDVYSSEGLLLNFVSQNRFDWNYYMETARFKDAFADNLKPEFVDVVAGWIDVMQQGAANLVFIGSNGTGKTHSAVAACRFMSLHGILRGSDNLYMPTCRTLDCADAHNVLDGWAKDQNAATTVDRYKNVPLLLMDDLGAVASSSQSATSNIVSIIGHRYNMNLPTVATSNINVDELEKLYGSAVTASHRVDAVSGSLLVSRRGGGACSTKRKHKPKFKTSPYWSQVEGERDWNVMIGVEGRWMSSHHWPLLKKNCHMKYDLPLTWCILGKAS